MTSREMQAKVRVIGDVITRLQQDLAEDTRRYNDRIRLLREEQNELNRRIHEQAVDAAYGKERKNV